MSHSFFLPYRFPLETSQFLQHHSVAGAFIIGGVTLRKEAGGGNPITWTHGAQGAFHSSSSPEAPHPLGAVGIVSLRLLQRNCQDLEAVGRCGGEDTPVHGTGLIDWHILPTSLSPETVHPRHSACLGFRDMVLTTTNSLCINHWLSPSQPQSVIYKVD